LHFAARFPQEHHRVFRLSRPSLKQRRSASRSARIAAGLATIALLLPAALTASDPDPRLGLPPIVVSTEPGVPALQIALGRKLFMDPQLAEDGTLACGTCHIPEHGFALNGPAVAFGRGGRALRRNSPTILNAALATSQFADGRMKTLEEQIWGPLLAVDEAWNPTVQDVVGRLQGRADYREAFRAAFAGRPVSQRLIGAALAAYERSIAVGGSRFDLWKYAGDGTALDDEERAGFEVFRSSGCAGCHTVGDNDAVFTDNTFRNTGIEWARTHGRLGARKEISDTGRFEVTGREADRHAFRVPSLRNVALTAPYMHDGSLATLEEVVDWYDGGGGDDPQRDRALKPLGLDAASKRQLVAFLRALTGGEVERLAREARASTGAFRERKL
jgi:cytochrome c peroxidase